MRHNRIVLGLGLAAATVSAITLPARGQETGGRSLTAELRQGIEAERNPNQVPGATNTILVANTDLSFGIASRTPRTNIDLLLDARLRAEDGAGLKLDRPGARLRYSYAAPGAQLDAVLSVKRLEIGNLRATDLVELVDGVPVVPQDLDVLQGTGNRTASRYRLSASFGADQRFGWGVSLAGTELDYRNTTAAALVDSRSHSIALNGRFDLTPVLRLDARLGYALRDTATTSWTSTPSLDLALTHLRPADGALRARIGFGFPEGQPDRVTVAAGLTHAPTPQNRISVDLGATAIDGQDTQLIGSLGYRGALLPTLDLSADLSRQVGDAIDGATVLTSAATVGLDLDLSRLTSLSFDTTYAEQQRLTGAGGTVSEVTVKVQLDRQLDRDWTLSLGVAQSRRDVDTISPATSERIFLTVGRNWAGRF